MLLASIVHHPKQPTNHLWAPILPQPILITTPLLGGNNRQFDVEDNRLLATMWGLRRRSLVDHIDDCPKVA